MASFRHRPIILNLPSKRNGQDRDRKKTEPDLDSCPVNKQFDEISTSDCDESTNCSSTSETDDWDDLFVTAPPGRKFLESWKIAYPFLEHDKKKNIMFCKICRQFAGATQRNMHFVAGTNNFRFSTIIFHKNSSLHLRCKKIAEAMQKGDPLELLDSGQRKLVQVLKLVYFMIKTKIPFTDFPKLCKRKREYGLEIGPAYTSHKTIVPFFAKYIAQNLEKSLTQKLDGCGMLSLIMDSSLTRVSENHQLVYVRYFKEDELKTDFLGVIDSSGSSYCIYQNLDKLFQKFNLTNWMNKIVHVFIDTWSNCPSWCSNFVETLNGRSENNLIASINVLPHKITRSNKLFNGNVLNQHFKWFIYDIFWFHNNIPEDRKSLSYIDKEMNSLTTKYGNLHKKISASFSFDTFEAVNKDWVSLVHLLLKHQKSNLDAKIRNIAIKTLQNITRSKFLWKLALVLDIFKCLTALKSKIEDSSFMPASLPLELKETSHKVNEAMSGRGEYVQQFLRDFCTSSSQFRGVKICDNTSLDEVVAQIRDPANSLLEHINETAESLSWVENTSILDTRLWPKDHNLASFGNTEFSDLYLKLSGTNVNLHAALAEWCTLKNNVSLCFPSDVLDTPYVAIPNIINVFQSELPIATSLLEKLLLLNFSSEDLEKGYCESNLLKSSERSRLSVSSLHNSMMIAVHGPPLEQFNPLPVMEAWMGGCSRRYHKRKDSNVSSFNDSCEELLHSIRMTN